MAIHVSVWLKLSFKSRASILIYIKTIFRMEVSGIVHIFTFVFSSSEGNFTHTEKEGLAVSCKKQKLNADMIDYSYILFDKALTLLCSVLPCISHSESETFFADILNLLKNVNVQVFNIFKRFNLIAKSVPVWSFGIV